MTLPTSKNNRTTKSKILFRTLALTLLAFNIINASSFASSHQEENLQDHEQSLHTVMNYVDHPEKLRDEIMYRAEYDLHIGVNYPTHVPEDIGKRPEMLELITRFKGEVPDSSYRFITNLAITLHHVDS